MRFSRLLVIGLAVGLAGAAGLAVATLGGGSEASSLRSPPVEAKWHYQLQGELRLSPARVYDIDGFDTPAGFVSRLHARGRYSIC